MPCFTEGAQSAIKSFSDSLLFWLSFVFRHISEDYKCAPQFVEMKLASIAHIYLRIAARIVETAAKRQVKHEFLHRTGAECDEF